jgi:hypothetical protein
LTGRFDEVSRGQESILRDIGRSHEIQLSLIQKNSEQDIKIAEACNDATEARQGLGEHLSGHWAWLGAALAAIPIVGGLVAWFIDKWKGSLAGGLK